MVFWVFNGVINEYYIIVVVIVVFFGVEVIGRLILVFLELFIGIDNRSRRVFWIVVIDVI